MDSKYYLSILYKRLKEMNKLGGSDWSLQFDNDPKYQSIIALDYLKKKINYIEWLSYSPDLSPI